jgi:cytochrome c biogenesis protein CcmG, thiol:disulfide interchange protein DsbE
MTGPAARTVAAGLVALGLLAGCSADAAQPQRERGGDPAAGAPAYVLPSCPRLEPADPVAGGLPHLRLPCLGGGPSVDLADLRGTPMVLNVWAAWCQNCNREMPLFAAAMDRAGDRVRFFGVHYKADEKYGEQSAADFGVPFPSVHDEDGDRVAIELRAKAPPQTLFVTAAGRVVGREIGEIRSRAELDGLVDRYLGVRL